MKYTSPFRAIRDNKKGLTLLELTVTIAIMTIIMGSVVTMIILMYKSYDSASNQSQAQNLCVLTTQKIADTLRYENTVKVTGSASGDGIYYDAANSGIHMGSTVFMKGAFKSYKVEFTFVKNKDNLLDITMTVKSKDGRNTYYTMKTDVYLFNGKIGTDGSGSSAVQYS